VLPLLKFHPEDGLNIDGYHFEQVSQSKVLHDRQSEAGQLTPKTAENRRLLREIERYERMQ